VPQRLVRGGGVSGCYPCVLGEMGGRKKAKRRSCIGGGDKRVGKGKENCILREETE